MGNKALFYVTKRNPFSREYGTWIITIGALIFPLILVSDIHWINVLFSSIVFISLFLRFYLLELINEYYRTKKISISFELVLSFVFMSILLVLFYFVVEFQQFVITLFVLLFLGVFNLIIRRKNGQRQTIFAQSILVTGASLLGAMNYYFIKESIDELFYLILLFNSSYFITSLFYVRSKTKGAPYHLISFILSVIIFVITLSMFNTSNNYWIVFLPTLIKTTDNLILLNYKVPLRRIGVNETLHFILYTVLFSYFLI